MTGIAIDIGTTTIQAQLVDLDTGIILETFSALNNQRCFGADIMSRISAAQNGKLNELFSIVNSQIENILLYFLKKYNLSSISKCIVSGNTVMLHIFCNIDPSGMGVSPYTPVFLQEKFFPGKELSLSAENIILLPAISAFIGADITAGLTVVDFINKKEDSIFIDIGTNGEIAVWKEKEKRLFCCSTAAGPCFEETGISCGLNASDFINVIAEMKYRGAIDKTGALTGEYAETGYPVIGNSGFITQKDVRQFQLAKSAIISGIKTICKISGFNLKNTGTVYIAGGIGFHINLDNAVNSGLLPQEFTDSSGIKTEVCGNTSLKGAVKCLNTPDFLQLCRKIISCAETADLANDKYFTAAFLYNMEF
ncbi:MAG: ASKHA domain-containing protein [Treponema sp.]|nr:ASKHA domain-containing protein [Treponema sp.]